MNPLEWERKHQIALILASIVGAALGVVLGYFVFAAGGGPSLNFSYWTSNPIRFGVVWWALFGVALGAGLIYISRMISK